MFALKRYLQKRIVIISKELRGDKSTRKTFDPKNLQLVI